MPKKQTFSIKWIILFIIFINTLPYSLALAIVGFIVYSVFKKKGSKGFFSGLQEKALVEINKLLGTKYTKISEVSKDEWKTFSDYKSGKIEIPKRSNQQKPVISKKETIKIPEKVYFSPSKIKRNIKSKKINKTFKSKKSLDKSIWDNYESVLDKF